MLREWRLFSLGWIMGRLLRSSCCPQWIRASGRARYTDTERRERQDDVDISRSARGLKLCDVTQSVVTMAGPLGARPYAELAPPTLARRRVITLSISY